MQLCSAKHMFLLNMLIVGLVETGPDTFLLQLQAETGEIVEYTVSKNDRNLSDLSYWEWFSLSPIGVSPVPLFLVPLAALASSALWYTALRRANRWAWGASAKRERVRRAAVTENDSQNICPPVNASKTTVHHMLTCAVIRAILCS